MKYNIENNIDFYNELYSSLNSENNHILNIEKNSDNDSDLCLITNLPLVDNFVELKCGHKFNYVPLYKDIFNHKKKFNNMEQIKTKLKQNQLRCPYCRNVQDELLPYYENYGYPKEHGVNFFDINKIYNNYCEYINSQHQCQYQIINFDSSGNSHSQQCHSYGYVHWILKNKHNIETNYCYSHKLAVLKEIREKIKESKKAAKLEEKTKKLEEKNKIKMALIQKKIEDKLNKNKCHQDTNSNGKSEFCQAILKSGKNKGVQCLMNSYKDCLCKRHYNLKDNNKNIVIEDNAENIVINKDIKI